MRIVLIAFSGAYFQGWLVRWLETTLENEFFGCCGMMARMYKWNIPVRAEWWYYCSIRLHALGTYARCFDSVLSRIFSGVVGEVA